MRLEFSAEPLSASTAFVMRNSYRQACHSNGIMTGFTQCPMKSKSGYRYPVKQCADCSFGDGYVLQRDEDLSIARTKQLARPYSRKNQEFYGG